jgi:protein TonB
MPADPAQTSFTALNSLPSAAAEKQNDPPTGISFAADTGDGTGSNSGQGSGGANGSATTGSGLGQGNSGTGHGTNWTQPRYRETPRPIYPESARHKGQEGTVLLRVLVDDEGRAKSVEINQSSGDDSLDRAARDAIQRWRFIPARHGEKAVESWIRIPVDFRLADSNAR